MRVAQFAPVPRSGLSFAEFLDSLPHILAGDDIRAVVARVVEARRRQRAVVVSCGGHVVKCGLAPVLIELMKRGFITALAVNGAVAIHDVEIALYGATSENVDQGLKEGMFGMAAETAQFINTTYNQAASEGLGAGEALGCRLLIEKAPHSDKSLLASGYHMNIPITVHVALGTDIVHMHPSADGAACGDVSLRDFRILTACMREMSDGGMWINLGSAVILPEVVLKALALLRNESTRFSRFAAVDCDFIRHHRATHQVLNRVKSIGGEGFTLTGHHEILIPLLGYAILEAGDRQKGRE